MGPHIVIRISAEDVSAREFRRIQNELDKLRGRLNQTGRAAGGTRVSLEGLTAGVAAGRAAFGTLARGLAAVVSSLATAAGEIEGYTIAFAALTGSTSTATEEIEKLREVARLPGVNFQQAIQGQVTFTALGVSADTARELIAELGNQVALVGGGADAFNRLQRAFRQTISLGKVLTEELNQAREASPLIAVALEEAFGTSNAEAIAAQVGEGRQAVIDNFINPLINAFQNQGRAAVDSFNNSLQNLGNAFFELRASLGEQILPIAKAFITALTNIIDWIKELNESTDGLIGDLTAAAIAFTAVITAVIGLGTAIAALTVGWIALNAVIAISPLGIGLGALTAIVGGIAAVAGALVFAFNRFGRADREFEKTSEAIEKINEQLAGTNTIAGRKTLIQQAIEQNKQLQEGLNATEIQFDKLADIAQGGATLTAVGLPTAASLLLGGATTVGANLSAPALPLLLGEIPQVILDLGDDHEARESARRLQAENIARITRRLVPEFNLETISDLIRIGAPQEEIRGVTQDIARQVRREAFREFFAEGGSTQNISRFQAEFGPDTEVQNIVFNKFADALYNAAIAEFNDSLESQARLLVDDPEQFLATEIDQVGQRIVELSNRRAERLALVDTFEVFDRPVPEHLREEIARLDRQIALLEDSLSAASRQFSNLQKVQEIAAVATRDYRLEIFELSNRIDDLIPRFNNENLSLEQLNQTLERGRTLIQERAFAQLTAARREADAAFFALEDAQERLVNAPEAERSAREDAVREARETSQAAERELELVEARIRRTAESSQRRLTDSYEGELDRRKDASERAAEERIREEERLQDRLRQISDQSFDYFRRLIEQERQLRIDANQATVQTLSDLQTRAVDPDSIQRFGDQIREQLQRQERLALEQIDPTLRPEQQNAERLAIIAQFNRLIIQNHERTAQAINQVYEDLDRQLNDLQDRQNQRVDRANQERFQRELRTAQESFATEVQARQRREAQISFLDRNIVDRQQSVIAASNARIAEIVTDSERRQAQIRFDNRNASEQLINALILEETRRRNDEIEAIARQREETLNSITEQGATTRSRIRDAEAQEAVQAYQQLTQEVQQLEQLRLQLQQGQLAALRGQGVQAGQRGFFGAPDLVENFREQQAAIRRAAQEELSNLENIDITSPVIAAQVDAQRELIGQRLTQQLEANIQTFTSTTTRLLAPIFQGASDFGILMADIFRNLDVDAQQSLADLEAETQRRIQQVRDDQTISAQQQARRIERIEQQSAERRVQIEQDLNRAKRESFNQFVQNFLQGIARQISAELQLQAIRSVVSSVTTLGLTAGLAAAGPGAAGLLAASAGLSFLSNLSFHNEANDMLARQAGRASTRRLLENNAARLGRESAHDIVDNFQEGFEEQAGSGRSSGNNIIIPRDATIKIQVPINDKMVQEIQLTAEQLVLEGRL